MNAHDRNLKSNRISIGTLYAPPLTFYPGTIQFHPGSQALAFLVDCYERGAVIHHFRRTIAILSQLAVADDNSVRNIWTQLANFATARGSLAGLESLYLTAMQALWSIHDDRLYSAGVRIWTSLRPERPNAVGPDQTCILIYDRENSLLSMIPISVLQRLWRDLSNSGFAADGGPAAVIRNGEYYAEDADGGRMSFGKCLATYSALGAIGGAIGGTIMSLPALAAGLAGFGETFGASFILSLGVWGTNVFTWGSAGGLAGAVVGTFACTDDAPSQGPGVIGGLSSPPLVDAPDDPSEEDVPPETSDPSEWVSFPTTCGGYPAPDDNGPGGPSAFSSLIQPTMFPNPEGGGEGGPKGIPIGTATFLFRAMPRLAVGGGYANTGFLVNCNVINPDGAAIPLRSALVSDQIQNSYRVVRQ